MTTTNTPLKQTALHAAHVALGAKMVDFGGWDMPLAYGSQVQEHNTVRTAAGMFDVSHMLNVDVQGAGAAAFLRKLVANNIDKLNTPGRALYSCMLNETGGVIDDLIIYWRGGDAYRVVVNASTADGDIAHMQAVAKEFALTITPRRDLAMIAVQGPQARQAVWQAMPGSQANTESLIAFSGYFASDTMIARTGYTGEDGFEIAVPAGQASALWKALQDAGVAPAGLGARDTLRLEAGMNLYGNDMDTTVSPLEAGLAWTVDMKTERDFIGRKALETNPRARTFIGLKLLERGVVRGHMKVRTAQGEGEITSGTFSPSMNISIAMARVPMGAQVGDTVEVDVRGKWLKAQVVKMPFVRNGKVLV